MPEIAGQSVLLPLARGALSRSWILTNAGRYSLRIRAKDERRLVPIGQLDFFHCLGCAKTAAEASLDLGHLVVVQVLAIQNSCDISQGLRLWQRFFRGLSLRYCRSHRRRIHSSS